MLLNAYNNESSKDDPKLCLDKPGEEGSFYFNNKVPFYYDYGGSSETGFSTDAVPDFDVHSDLDYHGSHVASITGANAPTYKGIAPKAQLVCMKVFTEYKAGDIAKELGLSDSNGGYDSCILQALEDCRTLGVDGINMSLGSDLSEFEDDDLAMETIKKMVETDKILTSISNGNAGKDSYAFVGGYANWTNEMVETGILGSYANNPTSMSIGSAHPDYIYYKTGIKSGESNIAYDDQIVNNERYPSEYDTEYKMIKYVTVTDCGTTINPMLAKGQVEGGIMQGYGMASSEEVIYNDKGKLLTTNFDVYHIPTRHEVGELVTEFADSYEPTGPFGAKSVGEIGIDTPPAVICNAVYNAVGVRINSLPITPEKILKAMKEKAAK